VQPRSGLTEGPSVAPGEPGESQQPVALQREKSPEMNEEGEEDRFSFPLPSISVF